MYYSINLAAFLIKHESGYQLYRQSLKLYMYKNKQLWSLPRDCAMSKISNDLL